MASNEFASYSFDAASRITNFSRPGQQASYRYDANGNRLSATRMTPQRSAGNCGTLASLFLQHAPAAPAHSSVVRHK